MSSSTCSDGCMMAGCRWSLSKSFQRRAFSAATADSTSSFLCSVSPSQHEENFSPLFFWTHIVPCSFFQPPFLLPFFCSYHSFYFPVWAPKLSPSPLWSEKLKTSKLHTRCFAVEKPGGFFNFTCLYCLTVASRFAIFAEQPLCRCTSSSSSCCCWTLWSFSSSFSRLFFWTTQWTAWTPHRHWRWLFDAWPCIF